MPWQSSLITTPHPRTDQLSHNNHATQHENRDGSEQLELLRTLLAGEESAKLEQLLLRMEQLESRITDPNARAADTSEILVQAIRSQLARDDQLRTTLNPVVVEQFHQTSRNDPEKMADALFPILGPAIRKMVMAMLTPDSKAKKRTYKLEQVFLIDKESGLPVCHVSADAAKTQDAAMVSGMLSAIQSFVHEAFETDDFDGLDSLQIGGLAVWIEWGPSAVLAAVIRGVAPHKLREAMQIQLERIHAEYEHALANFDGDSQTFEPLKPVLSNLLQNYDGSFKNKIKSLPGAARKWLCGLAIALVLLIFWILLQADDRKRWTRYVNQLEAEPGIVITQTDRRFRDYTVRGLKDPLATLPTARLQASGINPKNVSHFFEPYQALHPQLVLKRSHERLTPPGTVTLSLSGTTLVITGGDEQFNTRARRIAPAIAGVNEIEIRQRAN